MLTGAVDPPPCPVVQACLPDEFDGVLQLYCTKEGAICDPAFLIKRLAQLPLGAEFCDGGQHDSQEVLRLLLDSLHNDLVRSALAMRSHMFCCLSDLTQKRVFGKVLAMCSCRLFVAFQWLAEDVLDKHGECVMHVVQMDVFIR